MVYLINARPMNKGLVMCVKGFAMAVAFAVGMHMEVTGAEVKFSSPAADVPTYDFTEVVINVTNPDAANPFTDVSVQGQLTREGSAAVTVDGFCDAANGSVFRIRFMPTRPGTHSYSVTYKQQGLERTHTGTFNAVPSGRKGIVRLDPDNREHFIWEGTGEHFFWNGTTAYWLNGWKDDAVIRQIIDRLARLKVNRIRAFLFKHNKNDRPWGRPVVETNDFTLRLPAWVAERPNDRDNPGYNLKRFNVDYWKKYERLLLHAREKDVIISVVFTQCGPNSPPGWSPPFTANSEEERLFYRYGVARLAAYSNVMWDLANEHQLNRKSDPWAYTTGKLVKGWDPYKHLAGIHGSNNIPPLRKAGETWMDMQLPQYTSLNLVQEINQKMIQERELQAKTGHVIPVLNEEPRYEDLWPPPGRTAEDQRQRAWGYAMAGAYHTNGESAEDGTGVAPNTGGGWINGRNGDNRIMFVLFGHMVDFFTAFDWWNCKPMNSSVAAATPPKAYCLGIPGKLYVLHFPPRNSGPATLNMVNGQYRGKWYNPRTGAWQGSFINVSGARWTTLAPPDNKDWIFMLRNVAWLDAPSKLAASAASSSQITLSWQDNSDNETGFKIERKTGYDDKWSEVATVEAGGKTYSDTGLKGSTMYFYRVLAANSTDKSSYSNVATATTQPFDPTKILASRHNPAGKSLSWSRLSNQNIAVYYNLPRASAISLGIYDVTGNLVRVLADKTVQAGDHAAVWDRRDGQGNYLPGGIFFLRLDTEGRPLTVKMAVTFLN